METTQTPIGEAFELTPSEKPGLPSGEVISELLALRRKAKDAASDYGEAIKAQAEKFHLRAAALKSYIAALQDDKTDEALAEAHDLEKLVNEI